MDGGKEGNKDGGMEERRVIRMDGGKERLHIRTQSS